MLRLCFPVLYKGKYIPVGRRVFRETLIKGRKQKSPIILLPPYISVHELRLMLNINYEICFKAANVYKCGNKYTWRDSENRVFQTVNKRNVIIPYSIAAYVSKVFHFKPKLVEVELRCQETNRSENQSLSKIYDDVYTYEKEFYKTGKVNFKKTKNQKDFAVVSVIGHINHGKTTLLDKITNNNLALQEAGCITQNIKSIHFETDRKNEEHKNKTNININIENQRKGSEWIGNEQVKDEFRFRFTFLDTPGHHVFQIFRGRAAFVSDILIILISLEVGAEIQTEEAIKYADKFNLPVVFALNKFDIYYSNEAVLKAELKNQCRKMYDEGDLKRDYSKEIDNSICISSLTGYNLDKLMNRLFFFSQIINLPYHSVNHFYHSDFSKKNIFNVDQEVKFSYPGQTNYSTEQNFTEQNSAEHNSEEHMQKNETKWEQNFSVLQKYIRKSDCLLALDCHPFGTGIVIDISKDSSKGTLLNVVIRNGYFMEGSYFICGSAYGKIQKMFKHNTNFKENCTYATTGMSVQISGIKKYGNAATDDLIYTLPQNNAFRLCQYRLMVEKLCSLQISGTEIPVSWENDMKKNEYQAEYIYENRMQMTQKRKAIEEFGVPNTSPNSSDTVFQPTTLEDFYKSNQQLRKEENAIEIELEEELETKKKMEKRKKIQNIISSDQPEESILVPEDEDNAFMFFDHSEKEQSLIKEKIQREHMDKTKNISRYDQDYTKDSTFLRFKENMERNITDENRSLKDTNIKDIGRTTDLMNQEKLEIKGDRYIPLHSCNTKEEPMQKLTENEKLHTSKTITTEKVLLSVKGRKHKTYNGDIGNKRLSEERKDETEENEKERENKQLEEPWYYEGNEKRWQQKVLKRNEELTEKWRGKTRQREIEQERQKLYEKKMILQNEIMKRNLLGEEKLTEEEIRQYLYAEVPDKDTKESPTADDSEKEEENFHFPAKNCPVIPIILRTNYVGMFDIFLDEFEKLQKQYNVKIAVVHGGVGPITPTDVVHAEVESEFGYCCIYAFQVKVLPDSVKQAVLSKIVIKQFDVFTDLIDDVVNRIKNIKTLIKHNLYVRMLKTEET